MLGIDRRAARYTYTAAIVLLLLYLLYLIRSTIFIFVLALLLAYLLTPLVNALYRLLPWNRTRTPAMALAYVIFLGLIGFLGFEIGNRVVQQAKDLEKTLPGMLASWEKPAPAGTPAVNSLKNELVERARTEIAQRSGDLLSWLPAAGIKFVSIATNAIYIVIIPILAFFFLKDGTQIRQYVLELVPDGRRREMVDDVIADVHLLLARYMRALVVLSLAAFAAYSIFFTVTGLPFSILLAAVAAMLEFIPMVGPLMAAIIILIVTAASSGPVLAVLIFIGVYRMIQDYVLSPHLMGQGVQLHPLLVLFGVFAGAELAGVAGTFLSVPVLALCRLFYVRIRKARLAIPHEAVRQYE